MRKFVFSFVAMVAFAAVASACDRVQTIVVPQQVVTTQAFVVQPVVAVQQVVAVPLVQQVVVGHHVQQVVAVRQQRVQAVVRGGGVVQRGLININRR